ncbi:peptide chain release factor N(5)-glutamine methyltransferase [Kocuria sp.]|uniref:peptide chain release factor N(5)-glutamine methyltransferase n=1 Tax=Kocuria sp. TaxID=1871328 RepID=UPI0026DFFDE2|nr:peptide chain release factor N(5)-glutamine methyltransferase [Kocuria sp.]MDO5618386.1 peptide chain release factor N(5)-glutamine methyltransferase [Kocuria sp.]
MNTEQSSSSQVSSASGTGPGTRSLAQGLRWATSLLAEAGVETAENDAVLLAAHLTGLDRGEVQAKAIIGADTPTGYRELVERRAQRVPLQHLIGKAPFRRVELEVGPGVFIPRPETELLVELVTERLREAQAEGRAHPVVVDLCTGSGAIAAALADEAPHARIHAVELSEQAHVWAARNLAPYKRVELRLADATQVPPERTGTVDVVVSNPPYVPESEAPLPPEVADHDPAMALWGGGDDGMTVPNRIIAAAAQWLRPGGYLAVEHAESQAQAVARAFHTHGFTHVELHHDLAQRPRATAGFLATPRTSEPCQPESELRQYQADPSPQHGVQE